MDVTLFAMIIVVAGFFSALFSLIGAVISSLWYASKLDSVAATARGERGLQARADKRQRLDEATATFVKKVRAAGDKPDLLKIGAETAVEYPDVAMELPKHLKRLGKQLGIEGEDLRT